MKIEHAYHLICHEDGEDPVNLFIGDEVIVNLLSKTVVGVISGIGPKGIFLDKEGLKNSTWYNFEKIESIHKYV